MLPDIEALTDPFELPAQLRPDAHHQSAATEAQQDHSNYAAAHLHQQSHTGRQHSHALRGDASPQVGSGLLNSGATASSGPASTASSESGDPSSRTIRAAAKYSTAHPFDDLHVAFEQSGSLPLLDVDVDALTDQQAAYMLDVSPSLD